MLRILWFTDERFDRHHGIANHLSDFLQKDLTQLSIILTIILTITVLDRSGRLTDRNRLVCRCLIDRKSRRSNHLCGHVGLRLINFDLWYRFNLFFASHERHEFALSFVINKQFFGKYALVAQHVNQKTQRAQTISEFFKGLPL